MPSILPGFEYDIFISYRHNDNSSGWVTGFVKALQEELASTIKDPVSVYFDTNPHDGLLEIHNVNKSLEGKLKCLIFIPIVSQTYCDPKSFAWQHEFCAFNKLAKEDQFGRDIRLSNGNVASRILPIKIHELDVEDKTTIENEIVAVLRGIEFIFKSPGVNRPLTPNDKREENSNKTFYRDQVNKVANAIKEIVSALKRSGRIEPGIEKQFETKKVKGNSLSARAKQIILFITLISLVGSIYFFGFRKTPQTLTTYSAIAILPFKNNTGTPDLDYYGIGMASEISTRLSMSKQFKFISSLQATLPYLSSMKSTAQIGEELGVDYLISGLYQKAGDIIKVEVELVNTQTGEVVWALPLERSLSDVFKTQAEIAQEILNRFSILLNTPVENDSPLNLEAYAHYVRGKQLMESTFGDSVDMAVAYDPSIAQFEKAIALDSGFVDAWTDLIGVECFAFQGSLQDSLRLNKIKKHIAFFNSHFPDSWQKKLVEGQFTYRVSHDYSNALNIMLDVLEINPENVHATYAVSTLYKRKLELKNALEFAVKLIRLNPSHAGNWINLGGILESVGDNENALKAKLKGWNLSHSRNFGRVALMQAMKINASLDSLPNDLKQALGLEFKFFKYAIGREWKMAKEVSLQKKDFDLIAMAYWELNNKDSARYWAKKALSNKSMDSMTYYAIMGNRKKALPDQTKDSDNEKEVFDKFSRWSNKGIEIELLITLQAYQEATERLILLNQEYPELADRAWYANMPWYDKIKKDYPPFNDVVKAMNQEHLLNINDYIKL